MSSFLGVHSRLPYINTFLLLTSLPWHDTAHRNFIYITEFTHQPEAVWVDTWLESRAAPVGFYRSIGLLWIDENSSDRTAGFDSVAFCRYTSSRFGPVIVFSFQRRFRVRTKTVTMRC